MKSNLKIGFSNQEEYFLEWQLMRIGAKVMPHVRHFVFSCLDPYPSVNSLCPKFCIHLIKISQFWSFFGRGPQFKLYLPQIVTSSFATRGYVLFNASILQSIFHLLQHCIVLYSFTFTLHFILYSLYLLKLIFHLLPYFVIIYTFAFILCIIHPKLHSSYISLYPLKWCSQNASIPSFGQSQ